MECRVCGESEFESVIDLGEQPWGNHFLSDDEVGKEPKYPLKVLWCSSCTTVQLSHTVKKETMFSDHTYLSGTTETLRRHFYSTADKLNRRFFSGVKDKSILDIGSNDGTQLKCYSDLGWKTLGVESSRSTSSIANEAGIPTINAFYNLALAQSLDQRFDVINASGVFFHLEELHSVTKGVKHNLDQGGIFVIQFLYVGSIVENVAFDQIYHEHLLYYSLKTLNHLLSLHDLEIFDAELTSTHGGQMVAYVSHSGKYKATSRYSALLDEEMRSELNNLKTFLSFSERVEGLKDRNLSYIYQQKKEGKKIFGMGAPVKGNTLLNYFQLGTREIDYLVERNSRRRGLVAPGSHIPILIEDELESNPDIYYVLAWNFKQEILERYRDIISNGVEFYFPIEFKG